LFPNEKWPICVWGNGGRLVNRRFQLDSMVERLAWAAAHTAPHPYNVIIADA
jgi:hypothetical protein